MRTLKALGPATACLLTAVIVTGCAAAGTPVPATPSTPAPSAAPTASPIAHATGPTDLVLRMETGGGFVPMGFIVTQAPTFNLYGDGTLIYRSQQAPEPSPMPSPFTDIVPANPFRMGRLTPPEMQELLTFALETGGLRTAAEHYDPGNVADAPSTIFTINAGGVEKVVDIVALGIDAWPKEDPAIPRFVRLADRLDALDVWGKLPGTYTPARYRTVLTEIQLEQPLAIHAWPWPDHKPSDWTLPTDTPRHPSPSLVMTPAEVAMSGVPNPEGGYQNFLVRGPDGKVYAFAVRPLLPDETA